MPPRRITTIGIRDYAKLAVGIKPTGPVTVVIAITCFVLLLATKLDTLWMILGAAVVSLTLSSEGLVVLI